MEIKVIKERKVILDKTNRRKRPNKEMFSKDEKKIRKSEK